MNYNFSQFLKKLSSKDIFVIDKSISKSSYTTLDLSVKNFALNNVNTSSSDHLENYINSLINTKSAKIAYGGYLEQRNIYQRSKYFNSNQAEERNIHLGVDIWSVSGTSVLAVLDGQIHSFKNNTNFGDYGPTIIVKHQFNEFLFYSLYGHLSLNSIQGIEKNQVVTQGQKIGELGDSSENGDYPPHLHFQLILDIGDYEGDYPGVCSKADFNFFKSNCPDPTLLLGL